MAGSKFYGLKRNKGKTRNKPVGEVVEEMTNIVPEKALDEVEIHNLLSSLNEAPAEVEKVVNKVIAEVVTKEVSEVLFTAYGIYYDEEKKKFMKINIDYNPKTGYSKIRNEEAWADSAPSALNKLNKVLSLKLLKREEKI